MNSNDLFIGFELPKPLTKQELSNYFLEYKSGNINARYKLIIHNIRLVINCVCKNFSNTVYDRSELVSIGLIALIRSVDSYDINKGFEFSTYAGTCIYNDIIKFIRDNKKNTYNQSIDSIVNIDKISGKELKLKDTLEDVNADFVLDYEDKVLKEEIDKIIDELPLNERKIIALYFGFYDYKIHTQMEIASILNTNQASISRALPKILEKIYLKLIKNNLIEKKETRYLKH